MFFFLFINQELFFLNFPDFYKDPYYPLTKADRTLIRLENPYNVPVLMEFDEPSEIAIEQARILPMTAGLAKAIAEQQEQLKNLDRFNTYYINGDELIINAESPKLLEEESIMRNEEKENKMILLKANIYFTFLFFRRAK